MPYASPANIRRARLLRDKPTDAELRLWARLRGKQIGGHRFRRQVPIGPYIVDFACLSELLVIEVDGGQHATTLTEDGERTAYLLRDGFKVLRFWDNDVLTQTDAVMEAIRTALPTSP